MEQKVEWKAFESEWADWIIASVNHLREGAGLTVKQLAGRLREVGWELSDATAAGILSGRKRNSISVAELFAFAVALDASPAYFLFGQPGRLSLPLNPKLWDGEPPTHAEVAGWLREYEPRRLRFEPSPLLTAARDTVSLISYYSNHDRAVRWQSALMLAGRMAPQLRSEAVERAPGILARVAGIVLEFHEDAAHLGVEGPILPPLPGWLVGVDFEDIPGAVANVSDEDLRQTAGELLSGAMEQLRTDARNAEGDHGSPA